MVKQTAGRKQLGDFAPKFAELNDDVLFGEVWSREDQLSLRDRSLVTVVALMAQGLTDASFRFRLESARQNGITKAEIAEILTQAAFYAGWPKAWAAFRMAKEVWAEDGPAANAAGQPEPARGEKTEKQG
jgi:4-carboxymuconolactone decarboxylase